MSGILLLQLHVMIEGNLATYLADHIDDLSQEEQDRLAGIVDYNNWESKIKCIDHKFHANYQQFLNLHSLHQTHSTSASSRNSSSSQKHLTEPVDIPAPKHQRFTNSSASQSYPAIGSNAINSDLPPLKQTSSSYCVPCPALTDEERAICCELSGCHKCRCLFVDHKSLNCLHDYPDGRNYRPLTR